MSHESQRDHLTKRVYFFVSVITICSSLFTVRDGSGADFGTAWVYGGL